MYCYLLFLQLLDLSCLRLKKILIFLGKLITYWKILALYLFLFGIIAEIICASGIIINRFGYDIDYQNASYEREVLEYRLDHREDEFPGNEMLYSDIINFNNKLRSQKKWVNNPWTNWFNNEKIAALDYIELGDE